MSNKILSIIIPSYNTSRFVEECVPTFINDELFNLVDIYFIDDGATDDTKDKLKPYIEKYPNYFHFFHKDNGGHGSVINYGVFNCVKTKYFKVIDGDDYVDPKALTNLSNYLMSCNDDLVVSGFYNKYPEQQNAINPLKNVNGWLEKTSYGIDILPELNVTIHSATFKTEVFKSNSIVLPEKVFFEDNLFILYPVPYLKAISFINDHVYYYRLGNPNQSVSLEGKIKHYDDLIKVRELAYSYFDERINGQNNKAEYFSILLMAHGLSCYRNTILYYKDNKLAKNKCLEFYNVDKKYPLLIAELKKSKFHKLLFLLKFSCLNYFRNREMKSAK